MIIFHSNGYFVYPTDHNLTSDKSGAIVFAFAPIFADDFFQAISIKIATDDFLANRSSGIDYVVGW